MRVEPGAGVGFANSSRNHFYRGQWPSKWVRVQTDERTFVAAYRTKLTVEKAQTVRVHVSADQRYELFLDGQHVGRGPERGDVHHWFYETYDLKLTAGEHVIVARVWTLDGGHSPFAQTSFRQGFILLAEGDFADKLSTGIAKWEAKLVGGYSPIPPIKGLGGFMGSTVEIDGSQYAWGHETGAGDGWTEVIAGDEGQELDNRWGEVWSPLLHPATLPAMLNKPRQLGTVRHIDRPDNDATETLPVRSAANVQAELGPWQAMLAGKGPVTIAANQRRRVIIDLDEYYCAYTDLTLTGGRGAAVRLAWAEGLYTTVDGKEYKQNRGEIEGKVLHGRFNCFISDGGSKRTYTPLWWNCGRYVELYVETKDEPLTIDGLIFRETRYPIEMESRMELGNAAYMSAVPIMWRTMQMCMHETYMDCPYYEQLMYTGDTRLEVLTTYVSSSDDRLPRKAIWMYDASRFPTGITSARYPTRVLQVIPPFALYWLSMVYDFAMWRGDRDFIQRVMPGVRQTAARFLASVKDGALDMPPGWNFVDWVPEWFHGTHPHDETFRSGILQWQMIMTLGQVAELAQWMGDRFLAEEAREVREKMVTRAIELFWDEKRGLFADNPSRKTFSEHAQCFAVLSSALDADRMKRIEQGLLNDPDLARATIYFRHYLFETYRVFGRMEAIEDRLTMWYGLKEQGFKTAPEMPEPSRSDCHAWSAHPIYHAYASFLGIRPGGFGFDRVRISPQLGSMKEAKASMVHPKGRIEVALQQAGPGLKANVTLPAGVNGEFVYAGKSRELRPGENSFEV